jgi:O-antigen/teichoic acid export membrane protein
MGIPQRWLVEVRKHLAGSLFRNSLYLIMRQGAVSALGFVYWIVAARFYSPEQLGTVSALIAAVMLLVTFSKLGFDISIIKFLPAETNKTKMINSSLTIVALASLVASLIFIAGLNLWSPALSFMYDNTSFLICFIIFTITMSLQAIQNSIFVGFRKAEFSFLQSSARGVLQVILPLVMVGAGALGLFLSWGIGAFLTTVVGAFVFVGRLQPGYRPLPALEKRVLNNMRHYSFMNYVAMTLENAPTFILPLITINLLTSEATAYFRIAWNLASILFATVPAAVTTALFAEGSYKPEKLRYNIIAAGVLMLALLIPATIILLLLGDRILLLFGQEYAQNAHQLLLLLTVSWVPIVINQLYLVTCLIQMRMRLVILVQGLLAALTIGLNIISLPKMGVVGIGLAWIVSQTITAIILVIIVANKKGGMLTKGILHP